MANLKEIRNRIASVGSTMQITSAMKLVSAAKLKKAHDRIRSLLPYSEKTNELIHRLRASVEDIESPYAKRKPSPKERVLIVAITSNRGLCGVFNANVIKAVHGYAKSNALSQISLVTIGKKGNTVLKKGYPILGHETLVLDRPSFEHAIGIADVIMNSYSQENVDKVLLVYNHFKNAVTQVVTVEQFLPIVIPEEKDMDASDYLFEPNKEKILTNLLPKALRIQLYKAVCDSLASEHGARMTAMHKATDNASELRSALKLKYNKERQATITSEILDIVGGAEALGG